MRLGLLAQTEVLGSHARRSIIETPVLSSVSVLLLHFYQRMYQGWTIMPVNERSRAFRTSFDHVAEEYDAIRPGYPPALINDIVTMTALPVHARILEVGCGTGQATMPFAERGYQLTCLDLGGALLAIAQRKFAAYPQVHFHHVAFEDWISQPNMFDLVMSATAFHWVAPDIGYPKAADFLKDTGSLAIFSNEHRPPDPEFAADMYQLEQDIVPEWPDPRIGSDIEGAIAETTAMINTTQCFEPVIVKTYPWSQAYTTTEYLRLINTYSNYRSLVEDSRTRLFHGIADLLDRRYGGTITKDYLAVLYLARKRSSATEHPAI